MNMFITLVYNFVDYGIYLKGGTNLDYDMTPLYSLTIECSDARRNDTGHFTINLIRNSVSFCIIYGYEEQDNF